MAEINQDYWRQVDVNPDDACCLCYMYCPTCGEFFQFGTLSQTFADVLDWVKQHEHR